jgi:serine/threonine-protein kinase HipA
MSLADPRSAPAGDDGPEHHGGRTAIVQLDGVVAGSLTETLDRRFVTFRYADAYLARPDAVPVSLTLPLSTDAVETWGLHPFFLNLLPEGWLRDIAVRKLRVHETDEFGLLLATGADCAGAVEILPGVRALSVERAGLDDQVVGEPHSGADP